MNTSFLHILDVTLFVSCITGQERSVPSTPTQECLSTEDLKKVMEELDEAKDKWFNIEIHLGLSTSTLEGIEDNQQKVSNCHRKMLQEWLQNGTNRSWETLAEALGKKSVGHLSLKESILLDHCTQN